MRNKPFRIDVKRGIVRLGQFGNGPLPNWLFDTHRRLVMFRFQRTKTNGALL